MACKYAGQPWWIAYENPVQPLQVPSLRVMSMLIFIDVGALGAVTTKGVSLNGWAGNDAPRIAETPFWNVEFNWTTKSWSGSFKAT